MLVALIFFKALDIYFKLAVALYRSIADNQKQFA